VYKLDAAGHKTDLYSFPNATDGSNPYAGVIRDSAGNLYGTTFDGGAPNAGVVYKLDAAGVIRDSAGNLYGTASGGGTRSSGVVFKIKQ
jgi:uncharacterized repeat protein (TIGR03803 family)